MKNAKIIEEHTSKLFDALGLQTADEYKAIHQHISAAIEQANQLQHLPTGFIWMRHPSWNDNNWIPARVFEEDGVKFYRPFDDKTCEFQWDLRDPEWEVIEQASQPQYIRNQALDEAAKLIRNAAQRAVDKEYHKTFALLLMLAGDIDKLKEENEQPSLPQDYRKALELANEAMTYMGDILNAHDMAEPEDVAKVTPAFEAVRTALGIAI